MVAVMKPVSSRTWPLGSTTASLFVASMLVLQSLAVVLAGPVGGLRGGLFAGGLCLGSSDSRGGGNDSSEPSRPTGGHIGDQCCVFHCGGAGLPPSEIVAGAPTRSYGAARALSADARASFAHWPTLPVGSRAPPNSIL
jgi:hypothetical protein